MNNLRKSTQLIVKPADKNLGIVIMNTQDYLEQCLIHLSSTTYQLMDTFPTTLQHDLEKVINNFKMDVTRHGKLLYNFILPTNKHRIPRFYGLPKIHKTTNEKGIRPIISHNNSLLCHSAKFIDAPTTTNYKNIPRLST